MRIFLLGTLSLLSLIACQPKADIPNMPAPKPEAIADASFPQTVQATQDPLPPRGDNSLPAPDAYNAGSGVSLAQAALEEKRRRDTLAARGVTEINWEDLLPEGEEEKLEELYRAQMMMTYSQNISEGSAGDTMTQIGTYNTVKKLHGKTIRIAGYTVPFVFGKDKMVEEFLLVPYFGACLHAPPPPPNQTLFVKLKNPITRREAEQAVWVEGTLQAETSSTDLADAAYTLIANSVTKFKW